MQEGCLDHDICDFRVGSVGAQAVALFWCFCRHACGLDFLFPSKRWDRPLGVVAVVHDLLSFVVLHCGREDFSV